MDFDDTTLIDTNKTTAVIEGLLDNDKIIHQVKFHNKQPVQLTNQQGTTVHGLLKTVQVKLLVEI